jgi:hypothetical protein
MRNTDGINERLFESWRAGDLQAQYKVSQILTRKFLYLAQNILRDHEYAQQALNDAFWKLDAHVHLGQLCWKGEGPLYAYARQAVYLAAVDFYRAIHDRDAQYEAEHRYCGPCDDETGIEYVEQAADEDWLARWQEDELRSVQRQVLQQIIAEYFQENRSDRDRQIWEACLAWANTPGSDQWSPHQISSFLKAEVADLGLSDSAFYTALSRLKAKLTRFRDERLANPPVGSPCSHIAKKPDEHDARFS